MRMLKGFLFSVGYTLTRALRAAVDGRKPQVDSKAFSYSREIVPCIPQGPYGSGGHRYHESPSDYLHRASPSNSIVAGNRVSPGFPQKGIMLWN